ncbi:MAG TPA: Cupredoxin [Candidatus Dormibacteraeota bacterium]|nr:Cupredoxin [Candidatus Dormibacteraeota bacterium]
MHRRSSVVAIASIVLMAAVALVFIARVAPWRAAAAESPVYVHMNGANDFLEPVVAVRPGQAVVFVNQDTGIHTIIGYDPATGKVLSNIDGDVKGTPGAGHPVAAYTVKLTKPGIYSYYCSVHAQLVKTFGGAVQAAPRKGVDGFGGAMAGVIIVTSDPHLLGANPKTSARKILPGFYGG